MITYYLFCKLASIAILVLYILNYKKTYNIFFSLIQVLIPLTSICTFCLCHSTDLEEALTLDNLIYLFMIYFFPLLLCGILEAFNYSLKKYIVASIFLFQSLLLAFIVMNTTSDIFPTNLFFSNAELVTANGISVLKKTYTPLFEALNVFCFLYLFAIVVSIIIYRKKKKICFSSSAIMIFIYGVIISVLFFILNMRSEYANIECFIEVAFQGVSIYIANLLSYHNIETYITNNNDSFIDSGFVVFDTNKKLVAFSEKIGDWFPEFNDLVIGKRISTAIGVTTRFTHWMDTLEDEGEDINDIVRADDISLKALGSIKIINRKKFYYFALSNYTAEERLLSIIGKDSENITKTFKQYLDPKLYNNIINDSNVASSGKEMTVAVMFADIRNFTSITENIESSLIIKILNMYLSLAENIIHKNGGILDKYIGDAVMAFWIDTGNGNAAYLASKTALEIKEAVTKLEDETYGEIYREIFFGIGLNYGKAILGDVGSDNLKNYTIIGDTVNTASRLENITPKNRIYVTEDFANKVKNSIGIKKVEESLRVKGKSNALIIYEITELKKNEFVENTNLIDNSNSSNSIFYVCGARGSYAVSGERFSKYGGDTTCFIIKQNKHAIVIDCGSGFSNAKPILKDCEKIDVLLTHMHYDHCIGLLNWDIFPKGIKPTFYGNFSKWNGENSISDLFRAPFWPIDLFKGKIVSITDKPIKLGDYEATFIDANHPNDSKAIYLTNRRKKMLVLADAENCDNIDEKYLKKLDYLVYDGMYDDTEYQNYVGWGHSTWQAGVRIAQKYNVGQLIITHHNVESTDNILAQREEQAKIMYPKTIFAKVDERIAL